MSIRSSSQRTRGIITPFKSTVDADLGWSGFIEEFGAPQIAFSLRPLAMDWFFGRAIVRVQRSSDNAEQDFNHFQITNGELAAFCGGGNGFVATWYDQSGNNRDATASLGSRPQIVSSGVVITENGKPAVQFTGQSLTFSIISLPNTGQYVFSVCSPQSTITTANTTGGILGKTTAVPDTNVTNAIIFGNATNQFTNERLCWYNATIAPFSLRGSAYTTANIGTGMQLFDFNFSVALGTFISRNGSGLTLSASSGGGFISTRYPSEYNYIGATDATVSVKHTEMIIFNSTAIDAAGIRSNINSQYSIY